MEKPHPLVLEYQRIFDGYNPTCYDRMNEPGSLRKYTKLYRPLTYDVLRAHLRGDVTVAVRLINEADLARAAVVDIDEGGERALCKVLEVAEAQRFVAFGQSSRNEQHDGGHVWLLFDDQTAPERLRALAQQLVGQSSVKGETYPTRKSIRLPLGVHRWTGRRGLLYLPDGGVLDLDLGEYMVKTAIRELRQLPLNSVRALPVSEGALPTGQKSARVAPSEGRETAETFIGEYNNRTDLVALLESSGGRVAAFLNHGGALMHCPCPHHKHRDARPSLEVKPARNRRRYGAFVVFGYAPGCSFYTEHGQVTDAFGTYCKLHSLDPTEAVKELSW
jgi:hypothetical protein